MSQSDDESSFREDDVDDDEDDGVDDTSVIEASYCVESEPLPQISRSTTLNTISGVLAANGTPAHELQGGQTVEQGPRKRKCLQTPEAGATLPQRQLTDGFEAAQEPISTTKRVCINAAAWQPAGAGQRDSAAADGKAAAPGGAAAAAANAVSTVRSPSTRGQQRKWQQQQQAQTSIMSPPPPRHARPQPRQQQVHISNHTSKQGQQQQQLASHLSPHKHGTRAQLAAARAATAAAAGTAPPAAANSPSLSALSGMAAASSTAAASGAADTAGGAEEDSEAICLRTRSKHPLAEQEFDPDMFDRLLAEFDPDVEPLLDEEMYQQFLQSLQGDASYGSVIDNSLGPTAAVQPNAGPGASASALDPAAQHSAPVAGGSVLAGAALGNDQASAGLQGAGAQHVQPQLTVPPLPAGFMVNFNVDDEDDEEFQLDPLDWLLDDEMDAAEEEALARFMEPSAEALGDATLQENAPTPPPPPTAAAAAAAAVATSRRRTQREAARRAAERIAAKQQQWMEQQQQAQQQQQQQQLVVGLMPGTGAGVGTGAALLQQQAPQPLQPLIPATAAGDQQLLQPQQWDQLPLQQHAAAAASNAAGASDNAWMLPYETAGVQQLVLQQAAGGWQEALQQGPQQQQQPGHWQQQLGAWGGLQTEQQQQELDAAHAAALPVPGVLTMRAEQLQQLYQQVSLHTQLLMQLYAMTAQDPSPAAQAMASSVGQMLQQIKQLHAVSTGSVRGQQLGQLVQHAFANQLAGSSGGGGTAHAPRTSRAAAAVGGGAAELGRVWRPPIFNMQTVWDTAPLRQLEQVVHTLQVLPAPEGPILQDYLERGREGGPTQQRHKKLKRTGNGGMTGSQVLQYLTKVVATVLGSSRPSFDGAAWPLLCAERRPSWTTAEDSLLWLGLIRFCGALTPLEVVAACISAQLLPTKPPQQVKKHYQNLIHRRSPMAELVMSHALIGGEGPASWSAHQTAATAAAADSAPAAAAAEGVTGHDDYSMSSGAAGTTDGEPGLVEQGGRSRRYKSERRGPLWAAAELGATLTAAFAVVEFGGTLPSSAAAAAASALLGTNGMDVSSDAAADGAAAEAPAALAAGMQLVTDLVHEISRQLPMLLPCPIDMPSPASLRRRALTLTAREAGQQMLMSLAARHILGAPAAAPAGEGSAQEAQGQPLSAAGVEAGAATDATGMITTAGNDLGLEEQQQQRHSEQQQHASGAAGSQQVIGPFTALMQCDTSPQAEAGDADVNVQKEQGAAAAAAEAPEAQIAVAAAVPRSRSISHASQQQQLQQQQRRRQQRRRQQRQQSIQAQTQPAAAQTASGSEQPPQASKPGGVLMCHAADDGLDAVLDSHLAQHMEQQPGCRQAQHTTKSRLPAAALADMPAEASCNPCVEAVQPQQQQQQQQQQDSGQRKWWQLPRKPSQPVQQSQQHSAAGAAKTAERSAAHQEAEGQSNPQPSRPLLPEQSHDVLQGAQEPVKQGRQQPGVRTRQQPPLPAGLRQLRARTTTAAQLAEQLRSASRQREAQAKAEQVRRKRLRREAAMQQAKQQSATAGRNDTSQPAQPRGAEDASGLDPASEKQQQQQQTKPPEELSNKEACHEEEVPLLVRHQRRRAPGQLGYTSDQAGGNNSSSRVVEGAKASVAAAPPAAVVADAAAAATGDAGAPAASTDSAEPAAPLPASAAGLAGAVAAGGCRQPAPSAAAGAAAMSSMAAVEPSAGNPAVSKVDISSTPDLSPGPEVAAVVQPVTAQGSVLDCQHQQRQQQQQPPQLQQQHQQQEQLQHASNPQLLQQSDQSIQHPQQQQQSGLHQQLTHSQQQQQQVGLLGKLPWPSTALRVGFSRSSGTMRRYGPLGPAGTSPSQRAQGRPGSKLVPYAGTVGIAGTAPDTALSTATGHSNHDAGGAGHGVHAQGAATAAEQDADGAGGCSAGVRLIGASSLMQPHALGLCGGGSGVAAPAAVGVMQGMVPSSAQVARSDAASNRWLQPAGSVRKAPGSVRNPPGSVTRPDGSVTRPPGSVTRPVTRTLPATPARGPVPLTGGAATAGAGPSRAVPMLHATPRGCVAQPVSLTAKQQQDVQQQWQQQLMWQRLQLWQQRQQQPDPASAARTLAAAAATPPVPPSGGWLVEVHSNDKKDKLRRSLFGKRAGAAAAGSSGALGLAAATASAVGQSAAPASSAPAPGTSRLLAAAAADSPQHRLPHADTATASKPPARGMGWLQQQPLGSPGLMSPPTQQLQQHQSGGQLHKVDAKQHHQQQQEEQQQQQQGQQQQQPQRHQQQQQQQQQQQHRPPPPPQQQQQQQAKQQQGHVLASTSAVAAAPSQQGLEQHASDQHQDQLVLMQHPLLPQQATYGPQQQQHDHNSRDLLLRDARPGQHVLLQQADDSGDTQDGVPGGHDSAPGDDWGAARTSGAVGPDASNQQQQQQRSQSKLAAAVMNLGKQRPAERHQQTHGTNQQKQQRRLQQAASQQPHGAAQSQQQQQLRRSKRHQQSTLLNSPHPGLDVLAYAAAAAAEGCTT